MDTLGFLKLKKSFLFPSIWLDNFIWHQNATVQRLRNTDGDRSSFFRRRLPRVSDQSRHSPRPLHISVQHMYMLYLKRSFPFLWKQHKTFQISKFFSLFRFFSFSIFFGRKVHLLVPVFFFSGLAFLPGNFLGWKRGLVFWAQQKHKRAGFF